MPGELGLARQREWGQGAGDWGRNVNGYIRQLGAEDKIWIGSPEGGNLLGKETGAGMRN